MIETKIQGIPCRAEMVSGTYRDPDPSTWSSDLDYYGGWFDVEIEIYDRRGCRAGWLKNKMTADDEERITQELISDIERSRYESA